MAPAVPVFIHSYHKLGMNKPYNFSAMMQLSFVDQHHSQISLLKLQRYVSSSLEISLFQGIMNKLPLLILASMSVVAMGQQEEPSVMVPSCDLECANGGYCLLEEGTAEELAKDAQSGHLIEVCICQPGYTGIACENLLEQCSLPERRCHNGAPCSQNKDGEWGCDCSIADVMSPFAGKMCRKPITEYCSGKFQPGAALSFCTNGGRCLADFIAAQVAPGDTSVNKKFQ